MNDYFDEVEQELRLAVRRQAHLPWYARLRRRRHFRGVVVVFACLVVAGPALAAAGVFQTGTPLGPPVPPLPNSQEGVAIPGSVHLLSLRIPDPNGGPPWALRAVKTTRGLECVQLGRFVGGKIGVLGEDGAFSDDGRFHPLSDDAFEFTFNCGTLDADGHSFTDEIAYAIPASALENSNTSVGGCYAQSPPPRRARRVRAARPICPPSSLRDIYFGMLGPDATHVTYTTPSGAQATTVTAGPNGAYLIVLKHTSGPEGEAGGVTLTDYSTNPIRSIGYTDGRSCKLAGPKALTKQQTQAQTLYEAALRARFPVLAKVELNGPKNATPHDLALARKTAKSAAYRVWVKKNRSRLRAGLSCPTVGYVAPRSQEITSADVATAISARTEAAKSFCVDNSTQNIEPCGAVVPAGYQRVRANIAKRNDLLVVTWTSRVAVTNQDSHYEVYNSNTGAGHKGCADGGTSFGPTQTNISVGQRVVFTSWVSIGCPGISHGSVVFVQDNGPAGSIPVPAQPGEGPDMPVGKFSVVVP
jgi:hypothetical protein